MDDRSQLISFHVVPGPKGLDEAERRLRSLGFHRIRRSHDGQRLHVVAARDVVERVLGTALIEKPRRARVGTVERAGVDLELPERTVLPPTLQDVVADIILPVSPDYYQSPLPKRQSLL